MSDFLNTNGGWTTVTNQISPLGAPDFSSFLLNIANSGAEIFLNINWGHDAVLSIQQAKQFGVLDKQKLVVPYQVPFLAREVGGDLMEGVYAATDFWWTLEDKYPLAKMFVDGVREEVRLQAGMGRQHLLHAVRPVGEHGRDRRHVLSAGRHQGLRGRPEAAVDGGRGLLPRRRPPAGAPGHHRARQEAKSDMKSKEDYWEVAEVLPGEPLMQKPDAFGCKLGDYT